MEPFKCAFSSALMGGDLRCARAIPVTRRTGPDIACGDRQAHERCARLFERLKQVALPALGHEDDLLSMPHSALVKIQLGGVLGIRRLLAEQAQGAEDIDSLLNRATEIYGDIDRVPCDAVIGDITGCKLRRRK